MALKRKKHLFEWKNCNVQYIMWEFVKGGRIDRPTADLEEQSIIPIILILGQFYINLKILKMIERFL